MHAEKADPESSGPTSLAPRPSPPAVLRDPQLRNAYLNAALADIPRLLSAIDRNPHRATYGCFDRNFWHYRTAAFPSEMYQEGVLPLALAYTHDFPDNPWRGAPRVRELAIAALRFSARSAHADGSCDDYYPFERALGAAVFSLLAAARTYRLLELDDRLVAACLFRRARWIARHGESGRLANHHALAALGLWHVGQLPGGEEFQQAAADRLAMLLDWQSDEGWFDEYGGADPGYQTLTLDCLAQYRRASGDRQVDEPLRRGLAFARWFLHPDGSYAGEYGSRGTYHFFPHGAELLAGENADAADLADGFLGRLSRRSAASFSDDRLFAHLTANLLEAYADWSPRRPETATPAETQRHWAHARLVVRRNAQRHTVASAARGGSFKHFAPGCLPVTDAGLIVETDDGRIAVSQMHDLARDVSVSADCVSVAGPLHWVRFETANPIKQALLHLGMVTIGRWSRTAIRRLLQRRLITGRRLCPIRLTRRIEFIAAPGEPDVFHLRVVDAIELLNRRIRIRRMSYAVDLEAAYVAASGVYHPAVLQPWTDLSAQLDELNANRRATIVRDFF